MAQKKKSSASSKRKAPPKQAKRTTARKTAGSSAKRRTVKSTAKRNAPPKQTTALSTVAKVSDFSGMRSVTVSKESITVKGKRFPNNRQNSEVAIRELEKRGIKSVTYRV